MAGRNLKLTPKIQKDVTTLLRAGNTRRAAAQAAGIGERTFYRWLEYGEAQAENEEGEFWQFWQAVEEAEAQCEVLMVEQVRKAARGYEKKTTRTKTKSHIEQMNGADGKPRVGKNGKPITQTVTETETVEIVGFEFHPAMALEWLKRRRRDEWGDSIDIRKIDDETLLRLLAKLDEEEAATRGGAPEVDRAGEPAAGG